MLRFFPFMSHTLDAFLSNLLSATARNDFISLKPFCGQLLDWDDLERKIHKSPYALFLGHALSRPELASSPVAETFKNKLKTSYYLQMQETAVRQQGLELWIQTAQKHGIPFIVLRGDALAENYYPNPALRLTSDVDILIRKKDLPQVQTLCQEISLLKVQNSYERDYFRSEFPQLFLDIHTDLWYSPDLSHIWNRSRAVPFHDFSMSILSPEDQLIHLVAHSTVHHGRFSAFDALDIALVLQKTGNAMNWGLIQDETRGSSLGIFLYVALVKTAQLTGYELPKHLLNSFQPGKLQRWQEKLIRRSLENKSRPYVSYFFKPLSMPGITHKIRHFTEWLFRDEAFLRQRYGLTKNWQIPLMRAARPFLLIYQAAKLFLTLPFRRHVHRG